MDQHQQTSRLPKSSLTSETSHWTSSSFDSVPLQSSSRLQTLISKWKAKFEWMNEWMNMHLYSALLCIVVHPKRFTIIWGGLSSTTTSVQHPLGWCDGSHSTTAPVRSPHTSYRWRGDRDRANQVDGDYWEDMIDKGQWREFGQDTGVTPLLFYDECHGIFNDHRESGPRFNVSSERRFSKNLLLSEKKDFGPLTNSPVLFLHSPGKTLLTLSLVQKWLGSPFPEDVRAWWLLMHWLQLQSTPCEALPSVWISFAWLYSQLAVIPVACAHFPTQILPSSQLCI